MLNERDRFGIVKFNHEHEWFRGQPGDKQEWFNKVSPDKTEGFGTVLLVLRVCWR